MTRLTAKTLVTAFTFASSLPTPAFSADPGETLVCSHYTQANTATATCNDRTNIVCLQKCTGAVVVDGCTLGQAAGPLSQQTCTISFGQTSASQSICENQQGSFLCTGIPKGQATCSGCVDTTFTDFLPTPPIPGQPTNTSVASGPVNSTASLPAVIKPVVSQNGTSAKNVTGSNTSGAPVTPVTASGSPISPPPSAQYGKSSHSSADSSHASSDQVASTGTTSQANGNPTDAGNSSSGTTSTTSAADLIQASSQLMTILSLLALGCIGLL